MTTNRTLTVRYVMCHSYVNPCLDLGLLKTKSTTTLTSILNPFMSVATISVFSSFTLCLFARFFLSYFYSFLFQYVTKMCQCHYVSHTALNISHDEPESRDNKIDSYRNRMHTDSIGLVCSAFVSAITSNSNSWRRTEIGSCLILVLT